ncbi:MAG: hypothetical protein HOP03_16235 [Lysobacter sp.]|nr:hypothetical protein [Lysobacter sp.]
MEEHMHSEEQLFTVDLGGNGGMLEPYGCLELQAWLNKEIEYWRAFGMPGFHDFPGYLGGISEKIGGLREASHLSMRLAELGRESKLSRDIPGEQKDIRRIQSLIGQIYLLDADKADKKPLPHSSSAIAKAIDHIREQYGMDAARYFAALQVPSDRSPPHPKSIEEWYGVFAGLMFIDAKSAVADLSIGANQLAFDALRGDMSRLFEGNTQRLVQMEHDHRVWAGRGEVLVDKINTAFESSQAMREQQYGALILAHEEKMTHIREIFRNESALHAPAEYWSVKALMHRRATKFLGALSFVAIFASAWFVGTNVHDILSNTKSGELPETWRLGLLAVLGVFSVWAVRLVVRMFLSHLHLAGDAEERVVMLKTYLSLLQDGKTDSAEDRHLILQALFRPATDGIVKDEGVPTSVFELLTRNSK